MSGDVEELIDKAVVDYETAHGTAKIALQLIEDTMSADPAARDDPELRHRLACLSFNYARSLAQHRRTEHFDEILAQYGRAIDVLRALIRNHPAHVNSAWHRYDLARSLRNRGGVYVEMNSPDKHRLQIQATEEAFGIVQSIAREFPDNLDWADAVANYQISLAKSYLAVDRFDEGLRLCRLAEETASRLADSYPNDARLARDIGLALFTRGGALLEARRRHEAEEPIRRALDQARLTGRLDPTNTTYRTEIVDRLRMVAAVLLQVNRPGEAEPFGARPSNVPRPSRGNSRRMTVCSNRHR